MRFAFASIALAATLAAIALTPTPATAGPTSENCAPRFMTYSEFSRLELGMSPAQVTKVVGSFGRYARTDRSDVGRPVFLFVWDWCTGGEYYANQPLGFERVGGVWMLTEIR